MPIISITGKTICRKDVYITGSTSKYKKKRTIQSITIEYERWRYSTEYRRWRDKQYKKQNNSCFYCSHHIQMKKYCVEHVIPRSKGGTNSYSNLVLACTDCNKSKGSAMPSQRWIDHAKRINKRSA